MNLEAGEGLINVEMQEVAEDSLREAWLILKHFQENGAMFQLQIGKKTQNPFSPALTPVS